MKEKNIIMQTLINNKTEEFVLIPGDKIDQAINIAILAKPSAIILDLYDSVDISKKAATRNKILQFFEDYKNVELSFLILIRLNKDLNEQKEDKKFLDSKMMLDYRKKFIL